LITVYLSIDPLGYADQIREALAYLETELTPGPTNARYLHHENKIGFALERECYDEAQELTLRCLAELQADPDWHAVRHYQVAVYGFLSLIAFRRNDWDGLAQWAQALEEAARLVGYQHSVAIALLWQALVAQRHGDKGRAARLCRTAVSRKSRLQVPAYSGYYDALCHFHQEAGKLDKALRLRERQLQAITNKGMLGYEFKVLIKKCRLLGLLGKLQEIDLEAARQVARKLRSPGKYLEEIEQITAGRFTQET
jgi:hypothetical protein